MFCSVNSSLYYSLLPALHSWHPALFVGAAVEVVRNCNCDGCGVLFGIRMFLSCSALLLKSILLEREQLLLTKVCHWPCFRMSAVVLISACCGSLGPARHLLQCIGSGPKLLPCCGGSHVLVCKRMCSLLSQASHCDPLLYRHHLFPGDQAIAWRFKP